MNVKTYTLEMTKVDRASFLRKTLAPYLSSKELETVIASNCVSDCISEELLSQIGKECIQKRCLWAGGISLGTSMYGSVGTLVLYPLDFAQFAYHAAKLSQELYYLYGQKDMFHYQKQADLEVLIYMLAGADAAITLTGTTLSMLGQTLYRKGCKRLSLHALSALPFIGGAIHGSMSAYALYSLAIEYQEKLIEKHDQKPDASTDRFAKQIGQFIDVEYYEAEEKLRHFCNLEKLRELYMYLEHGYINEQEFEQLKLNL